MTAPDMTTPTPRTDEEALVPFTDGTMRKPDASILPSDEHYAPADHARQLERELAEARASVENYASAAEELRQEVNDLRGLIQLVLDYPYLPQNLATIIRKELDK